MTRIVERRSEPRLRLRLVLIGVLVGILVVAALVVDGADDGDAYQRVQTTNDTTSTTAWPETQAELPDGFDPVKLTPATATPAAVVEAHAGDATTAALEAIIREGFARFGADVADQAVDVAHCEAPGDLPGTLDPNATGDEGEIGLLQLHPRYQTDRAAKFGWTMADLYDPARNVTVAADLYAERGWQPWSCRDAAR